MVLYYDTFNFSVILWWSVLLVEETGVLGENKDCIGCEIKPGAFHRAKKKEKKKFKIINLLKQKQ